MFYGINFSLISQKKMIEMKYYAFAFVIFSVTLYAQKMVGSENVEAEMRLFYSANSDGPKDIAITDALNVIQTQVGSCTDTLDLGVESYNTLCNGWALLTDLWLNPSIFLPPGGTWTFPNGTIVTDDIIYVNTDTSGIYTYYYEDTEGCTTAISMQVSINPGGSIAFPANYITVGLLDPPFAPFDSLLGEPASLGGAWIYYGDNDDLLLFSGQGDGTTWTLNPADYFAGNSMIDGYAVYYSNDPGCGFSQDTLYIDVVEVISCLVEAGTIATFDSVVNLCIGDGESNIIALQLFGGQGLGSYGIADATTLAIVDGSSSGVFNMENYPPGNYVIGHVSYTDQGFFDGVNNVDDFEGCYDISNLIGVSSILIDGGTISTQDSPVVCVNDGIASSVLFEVEGNFGPNEVWALLDQGFNEVIKSNQTGIFGVEDLSPGIYKVVHAAHGNGVYLGQFDPQNVDGCVNTSNVLTLQIIDCAPDLLEISPNPAQSNATITIRVEQSTTARLEVFDLQGNLMIHIYQGFAEGAVDYAFEIDLDGLAQGVYLCRLTTTEVSIIKRISVGN